MIREATIKDVPMLVQLGKAYFEEADWKNYDFDDAWLTGQFYRCLVDEDWHILVSVKDREIVGFAMCENTSLVFTTDTALRCEILYILPEWRGAAGPSLIKYIGKLGKRIGAKCTHIGVTSGITTERTRLLYERLGFKQIGTEHRMEN